MLGRAQHRLVVGERRAERDVVADRAVEQEHVLQHAADVAADVGRVDLAQVGAVDQHRALIRLVRPSTSFSIVVLPEPMRPIRPTRSPGAIANETLLERRLLLARDSGR